MWLTQREGRMFQWHVCEERQELINFSYWKKKCSQWLTQEGQFEPVSLLRGDWPLCPCTSRAVRQSGVAELLCGSRLYNHDLLSLTEEG